MDAQGDDPLFVRAEAAAFDTTAALTTYEIVVLGDAYTLRANGVATLAGPLRDYAAFAGAIDPYETPNAIFLGDDTTSANGATTFSFVSAATVPEPTTLAALGAIALVGRRRRPR